MRSLETLWRALLLAPLLLLGDVSTAHAAPVVRMVCVRTPEAEAQGLNEWIYIKGGNKQATQVVSGEKFKQLLAQADIHYIYNAKAPPDSVRFLPPPYNRTLACPGHQPLGNAGTTTAKPSKPPAPAQSSSPSKPPAPPSNGTPGGRVGPKVTTWEELIRQISITASLVSGDVSGSLEHPEGSTSGIPSGKNVGAFTFPPLQLGVSILQILASAGMTPKSFVDDVMKYANRGQRTVITEVNATTIQVMDDLVAQYGKSMAPALRDMQTIMPYELAKKFTAGYEAKFQAHKIFEKRAFEHFNMTGWEKAPAIILDKDVHDAISRELAKRWQTPPESRAALRRMYEEVYAQHPHWLKAIEHYFQ